MIINLLTINRPGQNYLDGTLRNLCASDWCEVPVNLIVGNEDERHVEEYRERFNVVKWDRPSVPISLPASGESDENFPSPSARLPASAARGEEDAVNHKRRIQVSFCLNYIRALRHDPKNDVVICEDDIEFGRNWLARLLLAVREVPLAKYVLSLYTAHDLSDPALRRGNHYRTYGAKYFWGTQAVFYPSCARLELAKFIEDNMRRKPGDLLIGEWCGRHNVLFMTQGSLVQHVGVCTSGLGKFHSAWDYRA